MYADLELSIYAMQLGSARVSRNLRLAMDAAELLAASRVLHGVLASDHPMVQRVVDEALADAPREDARKAVWHLDGALREANLADEKWQGRRA